MNIRASESFPIPKPLEVLLAFLGLGLTSFGGPVAHLAYFRKELVERRGWLTDEEYADTVALCQLLPGPSSSQVAVCLGAYRAGLSGGLLAWLGFTLPSALFMIAAAYGLRALPGGGWLHGLKLVTTAVVAQAIWTMGRQLCPDLGRKLLALLVSLLLLAFPNVYGQLAALGLGGLLGVAFYVPKPAGAQGQTGLRLPAWLSAAALLLFLGMLAWARLRPGPESTFYLAGAMVFGGGHVILPLLQNAACGPGWVSTDAFLAGYGAAQAVPGPLFSFGAYLGTVIGGWTQGCTCLVALYLPSFLLLLGFLPRWSEWRRGRSLRAALIGVNAAVVGLLLGAFANPVLTHSIQSPTDMIGALLALFLLARTRVPVWLVVLLGGLAGYGIISTGQGD
ncbi:chromate efflux transporter [bacterium]|nr:chromate efflux transporter [bacterium]